MRSPSIPLFLILLLCPLCSPVDFILSEITAEFIAIVTLTLCSIFLLLRRTRFSLNVLDLLFLSFVLWYSLRMLFTASPVDGRLMIQEIGCFMLYFYGRYNRSEISFFRLLFIAAIFQAGWGILQWFSHLPSYHSVFSVTGSFHNPALWGIFSTLGLLAGTALFKRQQKNGIRILWGAGMFFLLLCIGLSASRASWIALAAGICWIGSTSGNPSFQQQAF